MKKYIAVGLGLVALAACNPNAALRPKEKGVVTTLGAGSLGGLYIGALNDFTVAWSGAGINLRTATPSPEAVRRAVRTILDQPRFRERARVLSREYASYDAVARAVELIEAELTASAVTAGSV